MNIENDFLTDFDLFGKIPELYYKGKSKKSSTLGIILTVIYIVLYIAFLLYKLIRMFKRVDVTFYDSYTFKGIPSINLTNNEFYGGFGMGGIVDERMYYLTVDYVSQVRVNGEWDTKITPLQTEICQLEWFGPDYQDVFADQPLHNYYCIRDVSGMILEGYSNLERYSYFNVKFFPCHIQTKDGEKCYDYEKMASFFAFNTIELKIQDNDLNPEDYKNPVLRRRVDMNSPVFKDLYQLIYSYLQIVNIETDEDITGLNFFTDHIRKQVYTRYDESFIIASPQFYGDIIQSGYPVADATLQLAGKVLTEKRQYVQLIDVLGDVGGLMEILYSFLNIISSLVTEILYDRTLVNNLFSFDLNKKYIIINKPNHKKGQSNGYKARDLNKIDSIKLQKQFRNLENNEDIEVYPKGNQNDQIVIAKKNNESGSKKLTRKKNSQKNVNMKSSKANVLEYNEEINQKENENNENRMPLEENKNEVSIYNVQNESFGTSNDDNVSANKGLTTVYINNWLVCCFWCTRKKNNVNKILFEEGSKMITRRLDIMNMFNNLYVVEIMQRKLGIEVNGMNMTNMCKKNLKIYYENNYAAVES